VNLTNIVSNDVAFTQNTIIICSLQDN